MERITYIFEREVINMGIMRGIVKRIDNKFGFKTTDSGTIRIVKAVTEGFIECVCDCVFLTGIIVFVAGAYIGIKRIFRK